MEKYGVPVSSQAESVKKKAEDTCLKRYGVRHAAQNEDIKKKVKSDWIKKYGVDSPMKLEYIKERQRQTSLNHYGVDHPWKSKEVQEKRKQTWINKYGVDNPNKVKEVRDKQRRTLLERYGVSNAVKIPGVTDKIKKTQFEHYGTWYLDSEENRSNRSRPVSQRNLKFAELLDRLSIPYDMEFAFSDDKRKKFDFHLVGTNILVELDSTIVHNSYKYLNGIVYDNEITDKQIEKSNIAEQHGYHCVHLFDWDNVELFVQKLASSEIPDNVLSCIEVDVEEGIRFFQDNDCQTLPLIDHSSCKFYGYKDVHNNLLSCLCVYEDNTSRYCNSIKYSVKNGLKNVLKCFNLDCSVMFDNCKEFVDSDEFKKVSEVKSRRIWSKGSRYMFDSEDTDYDDMISEGWLPVHDCGVTFYRYMEETSIL